MRFYKLLLWKAYFDKGWALTNYFKYLIAFGGLFDLIDAEFAIYLGILYCFACLLVGFLWFRLGLTETENHIQNNFNPVLNELGKALGKKTFK